MGCNVCRQSEPEAKLESNAAINNDIYKVKKKNPEDYNSFMHLFESNLQYIGKYISEQDFNTFIPEENKKYMMEHPMEKVKELCNKLESYEVKPVEFQNGNIYYGGWNDYLKMEGYGKYYLKEDSVLAEGFWQNGDLIYARVFLPNGDIYEGEMNESIFNGKGKLITKKGDIYEGDFVNGEKHGNGKMIFDDKTVYEGIFDKGEFKKGKMKWPNGYIYNGCFEGAKLSGLGSLSNPTGDIYEGNFSNNLFNGKGKYIHENGDVYEGDFQYGVRKGKGVYNASHKYEYNGDWDNNLPCGVGQLSNWNKKGVIKCTWRYGQIMEEPFYEAGSESDFKAIDLNLQPVEMNLNTRELSHLEIDEDIYSQYKLGTLPSFLAD